MAVTSVAVGATNVFKLRGSNALDMWKSAAAMQPQQVALTLSRVETEWRSQALQFVECKADAGRSGCGTLQGTFRKSCGMVVNAVVSASSGDKGTVNDYMSIVCNEPQLHGWQQERCHSFAEAILTTMTADNYENRENLNVGALCTNFWAQMSSAEAARVVQEHKLQEQQLEVERARRAKLADEHKVQEQKLEAEHARKAKLARAEAERAAAAAEKKRIAAAGAAKRHAAEAKREETKRQLQAKAAARAVQEAAAAKAAKAAAEQIARKTAAEKASRAEERRHAEEAIRNLAESQAAEAEAKLKEAETQEQETKEKLADAIAAKDAKAMQRAAPKGKPASKLAPPKAAVPARDAHATPTSQRKTVATSKKA